MRFPCSSLLAWTLLTSEAFAQAPAQSIRVGGNIQAERLVHWVAPQSPENARGVVRFTATIAKDGSVQSVRLASGPAQLVALAQAAVMQWRYQPTLLNGEPVQVVSMVDVTFPPQRPANIPEEAPVAESPKPTPRRPVPPRPRALAQRVEAIYPEAARQAGISGTVSAILNVDESGTVTRIQSISGPPELIEAASAAFLQWRYKPGTAGDTRAALRLPEVPRKTKKGLPPPPPEPPSDANDETRKKALAGDVEAMKDLAFDAGSANNLAEAEKWYRAAFEKGDVEACERAGMLLLNRAKTVPDAMKGMGWYKECAAKGSLSSMRSLASAYLRPQPELAAMKNVDEGLNWYKKAAAAGDEFSRRMISDSLRTREFWLLDEDAKYKFLLKHAEAGNGDAMMHLAMAHLMPTPGVKQDPAMAFQWAEKGAMREQPEAQLLLSSLTENGAGTVKDPVRSYVWLLLGSRAEPAAPDLTPAQIAQARSLARAWMPAPGVAKRARPWLAKP